MINAEKAMYKANRALKKRIEQLVINAIDNGNFSIIFKCNHAIGSVLQEFMELGYKVEVIVNDDNKNSCNINISWG